ARHRLPINEAAISGTSLFVFVAGNIACSFFFKAEDGIRAFHVTGVQTCALPISIHAFHGPHADANYRLAARLARLARVERVIAVAESEARRLRDAGLREPTLKVIYNGVPDHWSTASGTSAAGEGSSAPDEPGKNAAPVRPIDWRRELGWPVEAPIVGAVGRLEAPKGFD